MSDPSTSEPTPDDDAETAASSPLPATEEEPTMSRPITVRCGWDAASGLYVVRDSAVPGLVGEAPTMQDLMCRLPGLIRDRLGLAPDAAIDVFIERVPR